MKNWFAADHRPVWKQHNTNTPQVIWQKSGFDTSVHAEDMKVYKHLSPTGRCFMLWKPDKWQFAEERKLARTSPPQAASTSGTEAQITARETVPTPTYCPRPWSRLSSPDQGRARPVCAGRTAAPHSSDPPICGGGAFTGRRNCHLSPRFTRGAYSV